jgi:sulfonate transport system permease protein
MAGPESAFSRWGKAWIFPAASLAVWEWVAWERWVRPDFLPAPEKVLATLGTLAASGTLATDMEASALRVAFGCVVGGGLGLAAGVALSGRAVQRLFGGVFHGVRQVPLVGWAPLMVLWFGIGEASKLAFMAAGVFFPVALNVAAGLAGVPGELRELADVYGLSPKERLFQVTLPAAVPSLKAAAIQGLNMAWVSLVAAEILTATRTGIANEINQGRSQFRMDLVLAALAAVTLAGFLCQLALRRVWEAVFGKYSRS